jgi:hypothetical protein
MGGGKPLGFFLFLLVLSPNVFGRRVEKKVFGNYGMKDLGV